jgi:hypothetical protein
MLLLYQRGDEAIPPHEGHTVTDFTCQISDWRNRMSGCGAEDKGLKVLDILGEATSVKNHHFTAVLSPS